MFDPQRFDAPPPPAMTGALSPNDALSQATVVSLPNVTAPEDITFDGSGRLYTGCGDGRVLRLTWEKVDASCEPTVETIAEIEAMALGLAFDAEQQLVVAGGWSGVHVLSREGKTVDRLTTVDGKPIGFANAIAMGADGVIYFSDSSARPIRSPRDVTLRMLEARPDGRVIAWDRGAKTARVVADRLGFANGVALWPDGKSLLVAETGRYAIRRAWLEGERAGRVEMFADGLPGYPDGIRFDDAGVLWVVIANRRSGAADWFHRRPLLKRVVAPLASLIDRFGRDGRGLVIAMNQQGEIIASLHDRSGKVGSLSSVSPHDGKLWLATYALQQLAVVDRPTDLQGGSKEPKPASPK